MDSFRIPGRQQVVTLGVEHKQRQQHLSHLILIIQSRDIAEAEHIQGDAEQAKERLFRQAISLGGTLSGEHGIGLSKKSFMRYELNETTLELMKRIKTLFDPNHILNPGKIFPA